MSDGFDGFGALYGGHRYEADDDEDDDVAYDSGLDDDDIDGFDDDDDDEDDDEFDDDDSEDDRPEARAAKFRLPPGVPADLGSHATYGVALAVAQHHPRPKVAVTTRMPDWFDKASLGKRIEYEGIMKNLAGLIVHKPTDSVVGYMHGFVIRRGRHEITDACDANSGELVDMVTGLFTPDGLRLRDGSLRERVWGASLDHGVLLYIQIIELEPAHRGKKVLAAIEPTFSRFCVARGITSVVAVPGWEERIATATPEPGKKRAKMRDSLAQLGLKLIGITMFAARTFTEPHRMQHIRECAEDLPLHEWAATVNDEAFPALLHDCIAAEKADWERRNARRPEHWRKDYPLVSRTAETAAAVQGLCERDTGLLMGRKGDPTHFPLQTLRVLLKKQDEVWSKDEKLGEGIRAIVDVLDQHAMEETPDYGAELLTTAFPEMRPRLAELPPAQREAMVAFLRHKLGM